MKNRQVRIVTGFLMMMVFGCANPERHPQATKEAATQELSTDGEDVKSSSRYGDSQIEKVRLEYEHLTRLIKLDDASNENLQAWHNETLDHIRNWYAEHGPTIVAIRKKAIAAGKRKDLRKLNAMKTSGEKETVTRLVNEERKMMQDYRQQLEQQIPVEQLKVWQVEVISDKLIEFLTSLALTDDQKNKIEEFAAQCITGLTVKQRENWRGYGTAALEKRFEREIVTDQQKPQLEELQKKSRTRMLKWSDRF